MLIDRIFRILFSISTIITFLIASFIIIPQDYLKNFNIVAIRLSEIFSTTVLSSLTNTYLILLFVIFLLFFSYHTFKFVFSSENKANRLQLFLVQELKFSTSLIVIFWV